MNRKSIKEHSIMNADIKGALIQINKSYRVFTHRGASMTKDQVKLVLDYGIRKGYKSTSEISDHEVDRILAINQSTQTSIEL